MILQKFREVYIIIARGGNVILYDKKRNRINAGDILRFDNGKLYVVFLHNGHYAIQSLENYLPLLNLESFTRNNYVSAICIYNIHSFN